LAERGAVDYWDYWERPVGTTADVFVGHFWAFAELCRKNDFDRQVAVYVLSDPVRATALLRAAAERHGVPFPDWDLPPTEFDHDATMELADAVILVGNRTTLDTFDVRWRSKISLVNYAPGFARWPETESVERRSEFVYAATTCGLRKGFLDVIDTWRSIPISQTQLHVIGQIDEPYRGRLAASGAQSVKIYGWIPSTSARYHELLQSCRYAYIPTWVEGQMGTVLEVIAAGCVPNTASWSNPVSQSSTEKKSPQSSPGANQSFAIAKPPSPTAWLVSTRGPDLTSEYERWCGMTTDFWKEGVSIQPNFLSAAECEQYSQSVLALDRSRGLPLIERQVRERSLRYKVVDGRIIADALPEIDQLTQRVEEALERTCGPGLVPIDDAVAARNINVTPPGGEYRWHYDRNAATALIYLNEVPGGETELFPNFRILLHGGRHQRIQRWLDTIVRLRIARRLFGHLKVVEPRQGTLVIMRGNTTLHSVRAVLGTEDRIAVVLAYDFPGRGNQRNALNNYLYTSAPPAIGDPNYSA
jgi:hypothetical protein